MSVCAVRQSSCFWSSGLLVVTLALCPALARGAEAPAGEGGGVAKAPTADVSSPSDQSSTAAPATAPAVADAEPASPTSGRFAVLMASLTIFVLAIFVGFEVITKVPPTLHTPLMSGSNAISGITIVGAIIIAGSSAGGFLSSLIGLLAVAFAAINVVGGFLVTHRMLAMFKKR
jgi:NAD(P) transhydrogenase subunit alpha